MTNRFTNRFDRNKRVARDRLVKMLANAERDDPNSRLSKKVIIERVDRYIVHHLEDGNVEGDRWLANYVNKLNEVYNIRGR